MNNSKRLGIWLALVVVTALLGTAIYISINGFDRWKSDVNSAAVYMQAGLNQPAGQTLPPEPAKGQQVRNQSGQFLCPVDGASGLPDYAVDGTPLCPICGRKMNVTYWR